MVCDPILEKSLQECRENKTLHPTINNSRTARTIIPKDRWIINFIQVPVIKIGDQTLKFFHGGIKITKQQRWMRSVRRKPSKNFSLL